MMNRATKLALVNLNKSSFYALFHSTPALYRRLRTHQEFGFRNFNDGLGKFYGPRPNSKGVHCWSWINKKCHFNEEDEENEEEEEEEEEDDDEEEEDEDDEEEEEDDEEHESARVDTDSRKERIALGLSDLGPLSLEDVKNAYRAYALEWHPDRHNGPYKAIAEEKFKASNAAYQSLCDKLAPNGGRLIRHHVVALIAERQGHMHQSAGVPMIECYVPYVQGLMQNYYRAGGLTGSSLSIPMG